MKKVISRILLFSLVLLTTTSCLEEPQFRGISNFKIKEVNKKHLLFNMDVKVYNPNNKKIKIKNSEVNLYLNDSYIGKALLLDNYKMEKRMETLKNVPVDIKFESGILFSLLSIITGKSVKVRLEGNLKTTVSGFPITKKIDQTKTLNLKELGIDLGRLGLDKLLNK